MSQVHQFIRHCLWQLDSGMLENACRAIRETAHLPDQYAAAVILESRRQFPSASQRNDDGGSREPVGDARLEEQIAETVQQRERSRSPLKLLPRDVAINLAQEMNDFNHVWTPDIFETLCRIYLAVRKAAPSEQADLALTAPKVHQPGKEVRLARLVELADQCRFDREGIAEKTLRTELYDEYGQERLETTELFQRLPFLRGLVQNSVDQTKLREAALGPLRNQTVIGSIVAALLLVVVVGCFAMWAQHQGQRIEDLDLSAQASKDRIEKLDVRLSGIERVIGVDTAKK